MKLGVISDTHIPRRAKKIPDEVYRVFAGVDMIIHAGDLADGRVLKELSLLAPVEAVAGNMDPPELSGELGYKKMLTVEKVKIGLTHGSGDHGTTLLRAYNTFRDESPDCIVFGHSHQPYNDMYRGVLLFNPGSPTDKRRQPFPSVG
ncbi:MAG TPA: metallophosphoesterase family protein, partial [Firmicutes bacterium]|nr:metallophosphoesterase family protein [Bacillota bacterium]